MKNEQREEWIEQPDIPCPKPLTERAAEIIHRELAAGASATKLAVYFDTTTKFVRQADAYIRYHLWKTKKKS